MHFMQISYIIISRREMNKILLVHTAAILATENLTGPTCNEVNNEMVLDRLYNLSAT